MSSADACPCCASQLLQALPGRSLPGGDLDVGLRCPECETCFRARLSPQEAQALERRQGVAREAVTRAHDEVVRESMTALAATFGAALERDLLGADDFR